MAMMKSRKPKRYADGGGVKMAELASPARRSVMPDANYRPGFDPQHNYFPPSPMGAPQASEAPMDDGSDPLRFYYIGTGEGGDNSFGNTSSPPSGPGEALGGGDGSNKADGMGGPGSMGDARGAGEPDEPSSPSAVAKGGLIKLKKMAAGGKVRGCGIAIRGKGRGRMV